MIEEDEPTVFHLTISLILLAGFVLTIVSWLEICSQTCAQGHQFRIWGLKFEYVGLLFFLVTGLVHYFAHHNALFFFFRNLLIFSAVGAEILFIAAQKWIIGAWCPVCLAIASIIGMAAVVCIIEYLIDLKESVQSGTRGEIMKHIFKGLSGVGMVLIGFFFAFFGLSKIDQLQALEDALTKDLYIGKANAQIEAYLFSDWYCPACRKIEPKLDQIVPEITQKGQIIFVETQIHPESMNYTPYNLSFIINDKPKYLELRNALSNLSEETTTPTKQDVDEAIKSLGTTYQPLDYADIAVGNKYFKKLTKKFNIKRTPTLILVNNKTKKGKKLVGSDEITQANVKKAIAELDKS